MKILLDTHSLLWLIESTPTRPLLGNEARALLNEAETVYISSISIVEARIKAMLGKLELSPNFIDHIKELGVVPLDFSFDAANAITAFPDLQRHDPFDRMILAQSKINGLVLLTADKLLIGLNLPYVSDALK